VAGAQREPPRLPRSLAAPILRARLLEGLVRVRVRVRVRVKVRG
jgi:hypothetical protein